MKNKKTNILVYNISYKTLIDSKPLRSRFNKIDGSIRVYDGARYLVLVGGKKYDFIYNRIRYFIRVVVLLSIFFFYRYIITDTFKQHKNTITR